MIRSVFIFALTSALLAPAAVRAEATKVVVLDPGHGGQRRGTRSADGTTEAAIVLAVARHTKEALEAKGIRVVMTRDENVHVELDARVARANRERAATYVSIHANHAPVPERRGAETYILSAEASDEVASALLHREENETFVQEEGFGGGGSDLGFIVSDLERTAAHRDSARLAKRVQDSLGQVPGLRPSRGLRQAPFRVLRGAQMPAVLVELGYLSNAAQARYLASAKGQRDTGRALARGILKFFER